MSVEFPEEQKLGNVTIETSQTPKMVGWLLNTGVVKDEQRANYVLIGIAVVFFILTIIMFV